MAKRLGSTYQPGKRSPAWRKVKVRREQELVIGGWTPGGGNREGVFGSVLLGYYEGDALHYGGGVGTGFDRRLLESLQRTFDELATDVCPFDPPPPTSVRRTARSGATRAGVRGGLRRMDVRRHRPPSELPRAARRQGPRAVVREPDATGLG